MKINRCDCGGTPDVYTGDASRDYDIFVYCPACKCEGKSVHLELPCAVADFVEFGCGYGRRRAIREWNNGHRKGAQNAF